MDKKSFKRKYYKKKKTSGIIWKIFKYLFILWVLAGLWIISFVYLTMIKDLPNVREIENYKKVESTVFYDKDWNELYKLSDWWQKRTIVSYEDISQNMVWAIVSIEDKTFFENPWFDIKWMVRTVYHYIIGKSWLAGASTLSQQLIKNTLLTNERTIERKIKEIYLSYNLNREFSKENILEMYLNTISFWSNAYWIEAASNTFFWKKAEELDILESSILASLPKAPSTLSPYSNYSGLVWNLYMLDEEKTPKDLIKKEDIEKISNLKSKFSLVIDDLWFLKTWSDEGVICWINRDLYDNKDRIDSDWCAKIDITEILWILNNITLTDEFLWRDWDFVYKYSVWRKDNVLVRMLEDWKISFDDFKNEVKRWFWFEFKEYIEEMKYPHFIFYTIDYIEEKYWKEFLNQWWLKVYTSIDSEKQDIAQKAIDKYKTINKDVFGANNASLISLDNKAWKISAMVWNIDFWDLENEGQNNMTTVNLHPGSSFKPFVYAKAIQDNRIWDKSPIYDLEIEFSSDFKPQNFDWKFLWKMTVSEALNYSRNIPAVKMFYLAWWQSELIEFMREKLWIESIDSKHSYWATLALWTWWLTQMELAEAYWVFANMWYKKEFSPLLKIEDKQWKVIIEENENTGTKVISSELAYIMNSIMSDRWARPNEYWNKILGLNDRIVSAKTWTSTENKEVKWKNWEEDTRIVYPKNLWTAGYTPEYTSVVWVWNTNWEKLSLKANWLDWAWKIWQDFMSEIHRKIEPSIWERPESLKRVDISSVSWMTKSDKTPEEFVVWSYFIPWNEPIKQDNSVEKLRVDTLCMGRVWKNTPSWAIKNVTSINLKWIDERYSDWREALDEWIREWWAKEEFKNYKNIITNYSDKECFRTKKDIQKSNVIAKTSFEVQWFKALRWKNDYNIYYSSWNPVTKINTYLDGKLVSSNVIASKKEWVLKSSIDIWEKDKYTLEIEIIDNIHYSQKITNTLLIWESDKNAPEILIFEPFDNNNVIYEWDEFIMKWQIEDLSTIKRAEIMMNSSKLYDIEGNTFNININKNKTLWIWVYRIEILAEDAFWNTSSKKIDLEVIKR